MANPLTLWFILLVIFVIVVSIFYKIIKALVKSVLYALVIFLITLIVVLFFVHIDFQNFVKELDGPNYYLLEDENQHIILGYQENPYNLLYSKQLEYDSYDSIINDKSRFQNLEYIDAHWKMQSRLESVKDFGVHNMFIYSRESLQDKDIEDIIYLDEKLTKEQAINDLFDSRLSQTERTELFATISQNWNSKFFFRNLKNGNIKSYPDRNLLTFVEYSPDLFFPMFGFERVVEEK